MTGLEVPALLLGKLLIGKAITYAGGHALAGAGAHTLSHLGMHTAINVTASTLAAGGVVGGAVAAGHGIWSYKSLADEIVSRKEKDEEKPGALITVKGAMKERLVVTVFQVLQQVYAQYEMKDADGNLKTKLSQIRKCKRSKCDCLDYHLGDGDDNKNNKNKDKGAKCICGHSADGHKGASKHDTKDISVVLLGMMANEVYEDLGRLDGQLDRKVDLANVEHCTWCGCTDSQIWAVDGLCRCGHKDLAHVPNREDDVDDEIPRIKETFVEILAEYFYAQLGHRNWCQTRKTSLYEIKPCPKSNCADFNYAYKMPFGDEMCVCGSRDVLTLVATAVTD